MADRRGVATQYLCLAARRGVATKYLCIADRRGLAAFAARLPPGQHLALRSYGVLSCSTRTHFLHRVFYVYMILWTVNAY